MIGSENTESPSHNEARAPSPHIGYCAAFALMPIVAHKYMCAPRGFRASLCASHLVCDDIVISEYGGDAISGRYGSQQPAFSYSIPEIYIVFAPICWCRCAECAPLHSNMALGAVIYKWNPCAHFATICAMCTTLVYYTLCQDAIALLSFADIYTRYYEGHCIIDAQFRFGTREMASAPDRSCISVYLYIQCAFGDEELCAHLWLRVGYMRVGVYVHSEWDMFARALYMMEITDWATEPSQAKPQRIYIRVYMVALNIRWAQASHQGWGGRNGCRETRELYAESTFDVFIYLTIIYGNLMTRSISCVDMEKRKIYYSLMQGLLAANFVGLRVGSDWLICIIVAVCWLWNTYLTK